MFKIVSIIGARPQFIKAAPVSKILRKTMKEVLLHTGQHYDENMSRIFFDDLDLPRPDYNLEVGSGSHGYQTGLMMERIEKVLFNEKPDIVLVYGDTNSTLAGALVAVKLQIPIAHVEAGLRSYNRDMPEEINRILADQCSDLLFCPTEMAVKNLKREGIVKDIHLTGDVMYDAALMFGKIAEKRSTILSDLGIKRNEYYLATIHRVNSTDYYTNLKGIVEALIESDKIVVFPVHPRTIRFLKDFDLMKRLEKSRQIFLIDPVSYLDMIKLEKNAEKILTDSGGIQKEAYFYRIPCITLRNETEWIETVEDGWNVIVGTDRKKIIDSLQTFSPNLNQRKLFGDGFACEKIKKIIVNYLKE